MLKRLLYRTPDRIDRPPVTPSSQADGELVERIRYFKLPYIEGLSQKLANLLKGPRTDVVIAYSKVNTINSFVTRLKDPLTFKYKHDVVYSIPCQHCEAVYIGQTSQRMDKRITKHKSDIRHKPRATALRVHCNDTGHISQYNNAKILCSEQHPFKHNFLEMCHIQSHNKPMNFKKDIDGLSNK